MWQFSGLKRLFLHAKQLRNRRVIFNSKDKKNIFPKAFFSWEKDLMRSDWTNVERFVDLFMKMNDLHLSDFREMRIKSKGDFYIAYSAVMREIYSFLARGLAVPILRQTHHISVT